MAGVDKIQIMLNAKIELERLDYKLAGILQHKPLLKRGEHKILYCFTCGWIKEFKGHTWGSAISFTQIPEYIEKLKAKIQSESGG